MAKHLMLLGVSADKEGVLLFLPNRYSMWNGLTARVDESEDVLDAATRVFKSITSKTVQGWSKLAIIKDESLNYSVHVLFTVINEEDEKELSNGVSPDSDIVWDWWDSRELPNTMHNVQWLVPLMFDRQLKRPLHVIYQSDRVKKAQPATTQIGRRRSSSSEPKQEQTL
jgi:hypothetical protein